MRRQIKANGFELVKIIAAFMILLSVMPACKKLIEVPNATNQIDSKAVFSESANATSAVLGLYVTIMSSPYSLSVGQGAVTVYGGLLSDELVPNLGIEDEYQFYTNGVTPTNGLNGDLWAQSYTLLYQANACIEGVAGSTGISSAWKNQLIGESKFMRAYLLYYLVNLFGDVPSVTSTDFKVNAKMARTPREKVYSQIIEDLVDASTKLQATYPSSGKLRPNKYAALALLARVYLEHSKWKEAEDAAGLIISSGKYGLISDLNGVFDNNSKEAIFQLQTIDPNGGNSECMYFIPFSSDVLPSYTVSSFLLNAFEENDLRRENWLGKNVVDEGGTLTDYYYPYKYKTVQGVTDPKKESYMLLRLAEVYLIRAEARVRQTNLTGAISDLDEIRTRAGLPNTTAQTSKELDEAILHERQIELMFEWGHRWLDLKRTKSADKVMGIVTPAKGGTWSSNWQLMPIPLLHMMDNPALKQNEGYN